MKQEFIFIGPPGSGKGTQTKMLAKDFNLPHIDTGSLLRATIASGSDEGKLAASFMDNGQLVPIELVSKIIKNRLIQDDCTKGFILDGYPRSLEQALELDKINEKVDGDEEVSFKAIYFDIDTQISKDRIEEVIIPPTTEFIIEEYFKGENIYEYIIKWR